MSGTIHSPGSLLRLVLVGAFVALMLQTAAALVLLALQHSGREVGAASIGSDIFTASLGFSIIARRAKLSQTLTIGLFYFPTVIGLMFLEALYLDARSYGNTF